MVVMGMKGKLILLNRELVNVETLESGTKLIWCDHTVNNIICRSEEFDK